MNLLDTIRSNSSQMATQPVGVTDESQKVAQLLRAKSGKVGGAPSIGASNLQETAAVDQANLQMQTQVAPQAAMQQAGLQQQAAQQQQTADIQKAELGQQLRFNEVENRLKTEQLLNQFERDQGQLDLDKNRAQVQQFTQGLRLSNDKYVSDLQREGSRARLDNEIKFNEALQNEMFDYDKELQEKVFENDDIAGMSDRDFQKRLSQMGIDEAWSTFRANQKANQQRAMYQGIGSLVQAGIGAYGQYGGGKPAAAGPSAGGPTNVTTDATGKDFGNIS